MNLNIDKKLLDETLTHGIIDINEIRDLVEQMNHTKLENLYTEAKEQRKVWKGEGKDQRWKFRKADGSIVAKASEEKLKEFFMEYTKENYLGEQKNKMTFGDLYSAWLDYKEEFVGIKKGQLNPSTFRRYQRDYERYIKGTSFDEMLVVDITPVDIETFLKSMVQKHNLTKSCLTNITGYIKGAFFYARKKEILAKNPYDLVDIAPIKGFCKVIVKADEDRILSTEEMTKLIDTLHQKQKSDDLYIQNYAIELATLTGMRVGELAALKWECVTDEYLNIDFSEHRLDYADKSCEYYIGEPKSGKHRKFPMSKEIKTLLKKVKAVHTKYGITSEFIFANKEGRVNSHTISCAMSRRCEDANIETSSIHDIRRTVSSHLRTVLPKATVANMLGHLEETNEKYYNYDVTSYETKLSCLKGMYDTFQKVA